MPRDTDSIFDHGAVIVPDFVTPAEEARILLRIAEAPWMTDIGRRVQHYGYRYAYRGGGSRAPAPAFTRWTAAMAERLREHFGRRAPGAVHRERVPPRPGHRDARRPSRFRPRRGIALARRRLADAVPPVRHPTLRRWRHARRRGRDAPAPLGAGARRPCALEVDAWHRPQRRPGPGHPPLRHLPDPRTVAVLRARTPFRAHPFGTALSCCASSRAALVSTLPGFDRLRGGQSPPEPPEALARSARGGVRLSSPAIPILARVLGSSTASPSARAALSGDETCARVSPMDCR